MKRVALTSITANGLLASGALLLATSVMLTADGQQDPAAEKPLVPVQMGALSPEEEERFAVRAEELAYKVCNECHALDEVTVVRRTSRDWRGMVTTMATKGAIATKDQFGVVTQYLTRYFGIVPVNSATAEDLSAVLGLSTKDAAAIVAHRTANGRFANVASLASVPGIDKSKLEEQPEALKFD